MRIEINDWKRVVDHEVKNTFDFLVRFDINGDIYDNVSVRHNQHGTFLQEEFMGSKRIDLPTKTAAKKMAKDFCCDFLATTNKQFDRLHFLERVIHEGRQTTQDWEEYKTLANELLGVTITGQITVGHSESLFQHHI